MKSKLLFYLLAIVFLFYSCKSKLPYTTQMKTDLKAMYTVDQQLQILDPIREQDEKYRDSMYTALDKLCIENSKIVEGYFNDYGYPGISLNGKETSLHFWLIVQHADHDVVFQEKVLRAMRKEYKKDNVQPNYFALLYDRVQKNKNKPQLYGTQISWETGKPIPYKIKDEKNVNVRRNKMGLETLEEYLKNF